jgi:hypothetical protein
MILNPLARDWTKGSLSSSGSLLELEPFSTEGVAIICSQNRKLSAGWQKNNENLLSLLAPIH